MQKLNTTLLFLSIYLFILLFVLFVPERLTCSKIVRTTEQLVSVGRVAFGVLSPYSARYTPSPS